MTWIHSVCVTGYLPILKSWTQTRWVGFSLSSPSPTKSPIVQQPPRTVTMTMPFSGGIADSGGQSSANAGAATPSTTALPTPAARKRNQTVFIARSNARSLWSPRNHHGAMPAIRREHRHQREQREARDQPRRRMAETARAGAGDVDLPQHLPALDEPDAAEDAADAREHDDEPARRQPAPQQCEQRQHDAQHCELADLDADVERQQREDEMLAGELQRVAERVREAEAVHEPEQARDQLAPPDRGRHDVLERGVDDGRRDRG